jgi:hypothetical protein
VRIEERLKVAGIDAPASADANRRELLLSEEAAHELLANAQAASHVRHLEEALRRERGGDGR